MHPARLRSSQVASHQLARYLLNSFLNGSAAFDDRLGVLREESTFLLVFLEGDKLRAGCDGVDSVRNGVFLLYFFFFIVGLNILDGLSTLRQDGIVGLLNKLGHMVDN